MGNFDPTIQMPPDMNPKEWTRARDEARRLAEAGRRAGDVATSGVVTVEMPAAPAAQKQDRVMVEGSYGDEHRAARYVTT